MAYEHQIREVKSRHSAELLSMPGVCGVGVAKEKSGDLVTTRYVDTEDPEREALLPKHTKTVPVEIVHNDLFRKF
jgi:hypothetical protein